MQVLQVVEGFSYQLDLPLTVSDPYQVYELSQTVQGLARAVLSANLAKDNYGDPLELDGAGSRSLRVVGSLDALRLAAKYLADQGKINQRCFGEAIKAIDQA